MGEDRLLFVNRALATAVSCLRHLQGWSVILAVAVLVACGRSDAPPAPAVSEDLIPSPTSVVSAVPAQGSAASLAKPPDTPTPAGDVVVATETSEAAPPDDAPSAGGNAYVVAAGDTLLDLAMRFDVPMAAIQLRNDLGASHTIQAGQALVIPPAAPWSHASPFWMLHEVGPGETLGEIARAYDLSQQDLLAVNDLAQPDLLSVGEPLVLPLGGPMAVAEARPPPAVPQPTRTVPPTSTPVPPTPDAALASEPERTEAPPMPTSTSTPQPTAPAPIEGTTDMTALARETFRLINEQRAIYGRAPLAWNPTLAEAAQRHAEDCYQRGWCGHTRSDGSSMRTRIIRVGYDPIRWSECWAWYRSPALAVTMWMDEVPPNDPHRRTILSTYLTEVGVGVMPGNGHGYYFIADFGKPRP